MPTVSVVIPTYNSAHLLGDAIRSVLAQTYKDFEVIVVDDGSTDNTRDAIVAFGNRVRYVWQANSHISAARNHGFSLAKGEVLANLDADDLWLPSKLEHQMEVFGRHPDAGMVYCDGYVWDSRKQGCRLRRISELYARPRSGLIFDYILKANPAASSSAVFPRRLWREVGGLDTSMRGGQDVEFFARITAWHPAYAVLAPLIIYRKHSTNASSVVKKRSDVWNRIARRDFIRLKALSRTQDAARSWALRLYPRLPFAVRLSLLLCWHVRYRGDLGNTFRGLANYLGLIMGLNRSRNVHAGDIRDPLIALGLHGVIDQQKARRDELQGFQGAVSTDINSSSAFVSGFER